MERRETCGECGAENDLPAEAVRLGQFRCHACGRVNALTPAGPVERPKTQEEPVQVEPSYLPSAHNTPEAMRRAEEEASRFGCLVALLGLLSPR